MECQGKTPPLNFQSIIELHNYEDLSLYHSISYILIHVSSFMDQRLALIESIVSTDKQWLSGWHNVYWCISNMMTSSNGNIFRVTGPLCGEFWCFLWSAPEQKVEQTVETLMIWDAIALIMTSLQWFCLNLLRSCIVFLYRAKFAQYIMFNSFVYWWWWLLVKSVFNL